MSCDFSCKEKIRRSVSVNSLLSGIEERVDRVVLVVMECFGSKENELVLMVVASCGEGENVWCWSW